MNEEALKKQAEAGITDSQRLLLSHFLLSLGNVLPLKLEISVSEAAKSIKSFERHFKPYNPRKQGFNRYGLSMTSLDGELSGAPDLDSLLEYNRENGTKLDEGDFRQPTAFFKESGPLWDCLAPFREDICRSHILRLNRGGFFPYHRDSQNFIPQFFRLLASFTHAIDFVFLLEDRRIFFEPGRLYIINTRLAHSLFSYNDKSDFAVFNIALSTRSAQAVRRHLLDR